MTASPDLERTVIGSCLLEEESDIELLCSILEAQHFALESHRQIFRRVQNLHRAGKQVNSVTILQELIQHKELEAIGGAVYLSDLTTGVPRRMGERLREYADRLKEFWRLRELEALGAELEAVASETGAVASSIVQRAAERLEAVVADSGDGNADISSSIVASMDRFNQLRSLERSPGMSYGLPLLDRETGGMMPGHQTAAGALSGVGKTTFMCQAILAALESGAAVDAFLLEPTKDQVTMRLLSLICGCRYEAVSKPWVSRPSEAQAVMAAAGHLADMPLRLHDRASLTLDEVIGLARVGINRYGTRLVCLDYIQRLKIKSSERDEPMRLKVARASTAFADLVKGTPCHSLLLSQITTGRKSGAMAVPTMFDFRESSQIENDAHTIILLHRQYDEAQGHYTNDGAIFVPKQRFGSPCNIKVRFDPVSAAWDDRAPSNYHQTTWQERQESDARL